MAVLPRAEATVSPSPEYLAESNASKILAGVGVLCFLALVTVAMRLFVRVALLRYTGPDDFVLSIAMVLGVAVFICFVGETYNGLGRHIEVVAEHEVSLFHWNFAHSLLILFSIAMVKISVALLLLRIVPQKIYRRILWVTIGFLTIYTIVCAFTIIFACTPIAASWDYSLQPTAKCFSGPTYTGLGITNSVFTMLTDIILAVLPIPIVMGLQLNKRTKIALNIVLSLGFIAVACGGVKIYFQYSVLSDPDAFFHDAFFTWAAFELYIGIIACSLPSLRPLIAVLLKGARTTFGTSQHTSTEGTPHTRSRHHSHGYRKYPDNQSSVTEATLKNSMTSTTLPAQDDYNSGSGSREESYFGVNTIVSYAVGAEHGDPASIMLEDMSSSSKKPTTGAETGGIMRTMKVVTHSESLAAPQLPARNSSPFEYAHGEDHFAGKENTSARVVGDSSSVKKLLDDRPPTHQ